MEQAAPRVLLTGISSGCGKTTVACAVLQALVDRGLRVGAFKCGPDYIDPMFHSRIIGAKSGNLDLFFFRENTLRYLLARNSRDRDVSVIEGVMGYYDGAGLDSTLASSWETARAAVRAGEPAAPVRGMRFSYDRERMEAALAETRAMEGIHCVRAWLNEGELAPGDDIMYVLVGGDIRPRVVEALQFLVGKLKSEGVSEEEIFA